jgi:hypothetical protein
MADSDFERKNLKWGWIGPHNNNEVAIVSTEGDPPMLWLASASGIALGSLTFGRLRADGKIEAMVLIQGKQDERTRHLSGPAALTGEVTVHIRKGDTALGNDDAEFVPIVQARHDGVWLAGMPDAPPTVIGPAVVDPLTLPPGTTILLHGGASIVTAGAGPTLPPAPPPPAPEPDGPHAVAFVWKNQPWVVEPGDFAALQRIFGFALDRSDVERYQQTQDWQAVIDLYFYKSQGDE